MGPENGKGDFYWFSNSWIGFEANHDDAKKCNSVPVLISFQIFKISINRDFMNCCN